MNNIEERKKYIHLFDLDGTLTPSRESMTESFVHEFLPWLKDNQCYIATGSDIKKVEEQVPLDVLNYFSGIFTSMGNVFYKKGNLVYKNDFEPSVELISYLENLRSFSKYPYQKYQNYIEKRIGMINFSVLGRDCPHNEREKYSAWDEVHKERLQIQSILQEKYPELNFELGGKISIDIVPKGFGKEQIASYIRKLHTTEKLVFWGDRTMPGGNDYSLAQAMMQMSNTEVNQVSGPEQVLEMIKDY